MVTPGDLISATFRELVASRREIAIYLGGFFVAGLLADLISPLRSVVAVAAFIAYFVAQYYLYRTALTRHGIDCDPATKVFALFFMAILLTLPISFATIFFVVPGILLVSKFVMAPSFLVAEEGNLFDALGSSWNASDRNLLSIALTFTVVYLLWFAASMLLGAVSLGYDAIMNAIGIGVGVGSSNAVEWVGIHLLPVMMMGMSVAAFRALGDPRNDLVAIFE